MSSNHDEGVAGPFPGLGYGAPASDRDFTSISTAGDRPGRAAVAEEVPVAFAYRRRTHAVMMATPCDLEDLAIGFTLSEGIAEDVREIRRVTVSRHSRGIELEIDVPSAIADRLAIRAVRSQAAPAAACAASKPSTMRYECRSGSLQR